MLTYADVCRRMQTYLRSLVDDDEVKVARLHTSAYVSCIRQLIRTYAVCYCSDEVKVARLHIPASPVSIRTFVLVKQETEYCHTHTCTPRSYVCIRQHTSRTCSIRQRMSAYLHPALVKQPARRASGDNERNLPQLSQRRHLYIVA